MTEARSDRPPARSARRGSASPAREAAYRTLRRVFEHGAYADRALRAEAEGLDARDRALATRLVFGAVQRRGTLDALIARLARRPIGKLDPPLVAALRLGLYQLLFLDAIPDHAAVDSSVELVKHHAPRAAGLANAVLRRAAREGPALLDSLDDAARYSFPPWLAERWPAELMQACNEPAEHALRANTLVLTPSELRDALPVPSHLGPEPREAVVVDAPFDAHGSPLFRAGALLPQSRASMLVAHAVDPQPGERILDLCAAPGGKTTHLAALADARVDAVERNPDRADGLRRTARRMHATNVEVHVGDAARFTADRPYDRVLVDPPCSGLGTLRSRPDLRWRMTPQKVDELAGIQSAILDAAAGATRPGGRLVYSTCTISAPENEEQLAAFVERHPEFQEIERRVTLPHRDGTDGFFIAALVRTL